MIAIRRINDIVGDECLWYNTGTDLKTGKKCNPKYCDPACRGEDDFCPTYMPRRILTADFDYNMEHHINTNSDHPLI